MKNIISGKKKKEIVSPITPVNILREDGTPVIGDDMIRMFDDFIGEVEKSGKPVPMAEQNFIRWVKQARKLLDDGKSSEEIFKATIAPI